jgi:hypothetical protein
MNLIDELNQRINELKQLIQNLDEFAANRGVDKVECLFDFIPDEILFAIFEYDVGLVATLINKRFNSVYLSWITSKINAMSISKIQGWDDCIVDSGLMTKQQLYKCLIFNYDAHKFITYNEDDDHHIVKIKKSDVKYKFNFVNGLIYASQEESADGYEYGRLNMVETSTHNRKYVNIKCIDGQDTTYGHVNVIKGSCYAVYMEDMLIISDGEDHIILEKDGEDITYYGLNGLSYAFPKRNHPKYKEIMKILMSDNSPYPIEVINHIPM